MINPGKYIAKVAGQIVVYETEGGALCAAVPVEISEGEHTGQKFKSTQTMVKKDGTVMTRTTDMFKAVFGWDGQDPFWLMDADLSDKPFEIVTDNETVVDNSQDPPAEKTYSKVVFINAIGGGPGMKMPVPANRSSVLAKYGSKFRALAGATPIKTAAAPTTPPTAKAPVKKAPAKAAPVGPTATMEEAWAALTENNAELDQDASSKLWFATIERLFPGKNNSTMTGQEWHQLKEVFADNVNM